MSTEAGWDDAGLLRELAVAARRVEPVPAAVVQQARNAYAWRDISAVIARLEYDSLLDDDGLARVRSGPDDRTLVFRTPDTTVHVSVLDGGRRLMGQLAPSRYESVEVRQTGGTIAADVDRLGNFLVERVETGSFSLRCTPAGPGQPTLETEWVTI